jgi:Pyruvate/2-oxoacid:ferredoxin oxidoreductase gamma subunit
MIDMTEVVRAANTIAMALALASISVDFETAILKAIHENFTYDVERLGDIEPVFPVGLVASS